ncbi:MAG: C45 family autoproteolytic acyltransferase/hydrolase [Planctomyces sp.]
MTASYHSGETEVTTRRTFLTNSLSSLAAVSPCFWSSGDLPQQISAASEIDKGLQGKFRNQAGLEVVKPFSQAIVIEGSSHERGVLYGRLFSDRIHQFYEREILTAFVGKPAMKADLIRYAAACGDVIRSECAEIAQELEGMAKATGLRYEEHVLMTLHEELYHRGVLPPVPHCTAVAVGPPETKHQETFVGQTWDWMPSVAGMSDMLHWKRTDGPSVLAYAFPGLWVGAGMNSRGLALSWTSADLGKPGQSPRVGIPSYVLIAQLLYQDSLDAVRSVAERNRHAGWFTFVMADGDGRLMNIEGSPAGVKVEEIRGRLVRIGFGTHQMSQTPADQPVKRHPRCLTMESLLDQAGQQTDLSTLQTGFSDPSKGVCVGKNTIDMMVYRTTDRKAFLSRGADYGIAWKEFGFE